VREAFILCAETWKAKDGLPMVDYSLQKPGARKGTHADSIEPAGFQTFLNDTRPYDFDIMLEIKDKEKSAGKAMAAAKDDPRFVLSTSFE
jgi:UV DNA damage endonuclease